MKHSTINKDSSGSSGDYTENNDKALLEETLLEELSTLLKIPVGEISTEIRFNEYGLDSTAATALAANLGRKLDRHLPPTLAWDFPSVDDLLDYLSGGNNHNSSSSSDIIKTEVNPGEPVAVVGMACRLPGGVNSPEEYWELLSEGRDAISEVPGDRFDVDAFYSEDKKAPGHMSTRYGGYLDNVKEFDANFFGISPREAVQMDPQQRLMLELSLEALEDAGIPREDLRGAMTGVFVGAMWNDYARLQRAGTEYITQHTSTGQDTSIIAARLSYFYGMEGPSMTINTACSSSLVSIHLACQSLQMGESNMALAGGVNLLISPDSTVAMSKFGGMAPDGRSKAFDSRANGYVRGEGGGLVVLKSLSQAIKDGNRVYAVIRGGGVNNDGFSNGLTAPSPSAQRSVLELALNKAKRAPQDIDYVETHGTGTPLGDPIEAGSLGAVLGQNRAPEQPLKIGSVKASIGHLEAAAGVTGFIKLALSLSHRRLPASLHFQKPNPGIDFESLKVRVQDAPGDWPRTDKTALGGINAFGFGGTNCHLILEEFRPRQSFVLPLAAHDESELKTLVEDFQDELESGSLENVSPGRLSEQVALTLEGRQSELPVRVAFQFNSLADLKEKLNSYTPSEHSPLEKPVFVFTGNGADWAGMGRVLIAEEPLFRKKIGEIDVFFQELSGLSLLDALIDSKDALESVALIEPAIFAIQVALADLWKKRGVEPSAIVGHSLGEVAAAHVAGVLSLSDAVRIVYHRSRLEERLRGQGGMYSLELGVEDALELINGINNDYGKERLSLAAINSPRAAVISGDLDALAELARRAGEVGVKYQAVRVTVPFHSSLLDPMLGELGESLEGIEPREAKLPLISTVTGKPVQGREMTSDYWVQNVKAPVAFADALKNFADKVPPRFLEIGPHPLLGRFITEQLPATSVYASMKRERDGRSSAYAFLGDYFSAGANLPWSKILSSSQSSRDAALDLPRRFTRLTQPEKSETGDVDVSGRAELLALSAHTPQALGELALGLAERLEEAPFTKPESLAGAAALRRSHYDYRLALPYRSRAELIGHLNTFQSEGAENNEAIRKVFGEKPNPVFIFSGHGSRWTEMGLELAQDEPIFRERMLECEEIVQELGGWSLMETLGSEESLASTARTQVATLAIQASLVDLFAYYGIRPRAVLGHSLGEVAAAYTAGVLSLRDALRVVYIRGLACAEADGKDGGMLLVGLSAAETANVIKTYEGKIWIAAENGPATTVLSGNKMKLEELGDVLDDQDVFWSHVKVNFPSHSPMMDPYLEQMRVGLKDIKPGRANLPLYSTVENRLLEGVEMNADYWVANLREKVRYYEGVKNVIADGYNIFLEMSPHPVITHSAKEAIKEVGSEALALGALNRHEKGRLSILRSLGELYKAGLEGDWTRLFDENALKFAKLPMYPWQRERFWLEPSPAMNGPVMSGEASAGANAAHRGVDAEIVTEDPLDVTEMLGVQWENIGLIPREFPLGDDTPWLVIEDQAEIGSRFVNLLKNEGYKYLVTNPRELEKYLKGPEKVKPAGVIYLRGLDIPAGMPESESDERLEIQKTILAELPGVVRALSEAEIGPDFRFILATRGAVEPDSETSPGSPLQAPLVGIALTLQSEQSALHCHWIDLDPEAEDAGQKGLLWKLKGLAGETRSVIRGNVCSGARAYRYEAENNDRYEADPLGWYLITGGTGGLGLLFSEWLIERGVRRLVLTSRRGLPEDREERIAAFREKGVEVRIAALDVADENAAARLVAELDGPLKGVLHAAGLREDSLFMNEDPERMSRVMSPKINGTLSLHRATQNSDLEFFVLFSSTSSVFGLPGAGSYAAANAFLDSFALWRQGQGLTALSLSWGQWDMEGAIGDESSKANLRNLGLPAFVPAEGLKAFEKALLSQESHLVVTPIDMERYLARSFGANSFLSNLLEKPVSIEQETRAPSPVEKERNLLRELKGLSKEEAKAQLEKYILSRTDFILGRAPGGARDPERSFTSQGMDSLMALELKNEVQRELKISLSPMAAMQHPTARKLVTHISDVLNLSEDQNEIVESAIHQVMEGEYTKRSGKEQEAPILDTEPRPLAENQKSLWFIQKMDAKNVAYNVSMAFRIQRKVNPGAFLEALSALFRKHPSLTIGFLERDGEPMQKLHPDREPDFAMKNAGEDLEVLLEKEAHKPFNLMEDSLMRVRLYRLDAEHHVAQIIVHHIATDMSSLALLIKDFRELYRSLKDGKEPDVSPGPDYFDYVEEQKRFLSGPELDRELAYWKKKLAGDLPTLNLHTDFPRPSQQTFSGSSHPFRIEKGLADDLKIAAKKVESTLYVTLLSAFYVLLQRHSGQDDIIVGTPTSGRNRPEWENMTGYFVNPIPLRADLSGAPSFKELLGRVRKTTIDAVDHQELPFSQLVENLQIERDPSRSPIFQVVFVLQSTHHLDEEGLPAFSVWDSGASLQLEGLTMEQVNFPRNISMFDLTLSLAEVDGGLAAAFEYNRDLFEEETIQRLAGQYLRLLGSVIESPERPIDQLELLSPSEKTLLLDELAGKPVVRNEIQLAHDQVVELARVNPEKVALSSGESALSYGELETLSRALAIRLRELGVNHGDNVAVCMERSPELPASLLGVLRSDAAYVPMDPEYPDDRLAYILSQSESKVLITVSSLKERFSDIPEGFPVLYLDRMQDELLEEEGPAPETKATGESRAYIIYTSGSTGRPKGVEVQHKSLINLLEWHWREFDVSGEDRSTLMAGVGFDASVWEIWPYLAKGASLFITDAETRLSLEDLRDWYVDNEITIGFLPTPLAESMMAMEWPEHTALRRILTGGDKLRIRPDVNAPFTLYNNYGPTENTVVSTCGAVAVKIEGEQGDPDIGRPIDGVEIFVVDENMELTPPGVPGEMLIGGSSLARGYYNRPDLTSEMFIPHLFLSPDSGRQGERLYRSGDLVRWNSEGHIEFLGRIDHQVKIRGFRIEPSEIESVLLEDSRIKDALVIPREDDGEKRLAAYLITKDSSAGGESEITRESLRRRLSEKLPDYMLPAGYVFLETFPITPNGKVDRKALPAPVIVKSAEISSALPRTDTEKLLGEVWKEVLGLGSVGIHENFFELGGHSLLAIRLQSRVKEILHRDLKVTDIFQFPTIDSLSNLLSDSPGAQAEGSAKSNQENRPTKTVATKESASSDIAVIGMAGRFPGAQNLDEFWTNIRDGKESIHFATPEELSGLSAEILNDPGFVPAHGALEGVEYFDAQFFGYSAREAETMDPQHRMILECAYEAMESSGYSQDEYDYPVGVFAGAAANKYGDLKGDLFSSPAEFYQATVGNDRDFLATRISYKLNLQGPSFNVQTACSTSLVAMHLAARSIINGECHMALAGGVSIRLPQKVGYIHQEGMILSPDGHCRPFDADAQGTVSGNGVGMVLLKKLEDARRDGDPIRAIIKATAVNNDGSVKVGFTAPGVEGQKKVIGDALKTANVSPETIDYVETHGTGTPLGDPIEVAALTQAYREHTEKSGYVALGSLKSNVGHLDAAAGVAGVIKTILSLENKQLAPSLNYENPNPQIDFENGPFFVNNSLRDWKKRNHPRRAAVSSFGLGGTNAHAILEEAPVGAGARKERESKPAHSLVLSAKTPDALKRRTEDLAEYLEANSNVNLADLAYTLQVGRQAMSQRRAVSVRNIEEALQALRGANGAALFEGRALREEELVFMFPGQGGQYKDMGRGLFENLSVYRDEVERCSIIVEKELGMSLSETLYSAEENSESIEEQANHLAKTSVTLPLLFTVEYALAKSWMKLGAKPRAMIGHGVGEYVAATLAGTISLEDALRMVIMRGRLNETAQKADTCSLHISESEALELIKSAGLEGKVTLTAVNSADLCNVAGSFENVAKLEKYLEGREEEIGQVCSRLATSHTFHAILSSQDKSEFLKVLRGVELKAPSIAFISSVTGDWITPEDAQNPDYWVRQLVETVRFSQGLQAISERHSPSFLEIGPGGVLTGLCAQNSELNLDSERYLSIRWARDERDDYEFFQETLGRLWLKGVAVDWAGLYEGEHRSRINLPTYPFERQYYWQGPVGVEMLGGRQVEQVAEVVVPEKEVAPPPMYTAVWKDAGEIESESRETSGGNFSRLVFLNDDRLGSLLEEFLREQSGPLVVVRPGASFEQVDSTSFRLNPGSREDYSRLLDALPDFYPERIMHLWNTACAAPLYHSGRIESHLDRIFYSPLFLVQAIREKGREANPDMLFVSQGAYQANGQEELRPEGALVFGAVRVIPQEIEGFRCKQLDLQSLNPTAELVESLCQEWEDRSGEERIALRRDEGGVLRRLAMTFEPAVNSAGSEPGRERKELLRENGTYLVTGGLGGIGLALAKETTRVGGVKLSLLGRSEFPPRAEWRAILEDGQTDDLLLEQIKEVQELERAGAEVIILQADVADERALREALEATIARFGAINGVIHSAGVGGGGLVAFKTRESSERTLAPKVFGSLNLIKNLEELNQQLDFFVMCSSLTAVLGGVGQYDYTAANTYQDALAVYLSGWTRAISINWDGWREAGMALKTVVPEGLKARRDEVVRNGMSNAEGQAVFREALRSAHSQVLVSVTDPEERRQSSKGNLMEADSYGSGMPEWKKSETEAAAPARVDEKTAPAPKKQEPVIRKIERSEKKPAVEKLPREGVFKPRPFMNTEYTAPESEVQAILADVWETFLKIEQIGINDNFFALGGDSLMAVSLATKIRKHMGVRIAPESLVGSPTIAELSTKVKIGERKPVKRDKTVEVAASAAAPRPAVKEAAEVKVGKLPREGVFKPRPFMNTEYAAPESEVQAILADIWETFLKIERVGINDNFFALGGDSLMAVSLATKIRKHMGVRIAPESLVGSPTIAELSASVSSGKAAVLKKVAPAVVNGREGIQKASAAAGSSGTAVIAKPAIKKAPRASNFKPRPYMNTEYVAPAGETQEVLADIWENFLKLERVGVNDNFFALGGDSLMAVGLATKIRKRLGVRIAPESLVGSPTIAELSKTVEGVPAQAVVAGGQNKEVGYVSAPTYKENPKEAVYGAGDEFEDRKDANRYWDSENAEDDEEFEDLWRPTLLQKGNEDGKTLFLMPALGGYSFFYRDLASGLDPAHTVYGFVTKGMSGEAPPLRSIEEIATFNIREMKKIQSEGPYNLGGSSFGGLVSYEMARQLRLQDEEVEVLFLIDSHRPAEMPVEIDENRTVLDHFKELYLTPEKQKVDFKQMDEESQMLYLMEHADLEGVLPRGLDREDARMVLDIILIYAEALFKFEPKPYEGHVHYFQAEKHRPKFDPADPPAAWIRLAKGGVDILKVPGDHLSMNYAPNVHKVSERLNLVFKGEKF